MYGNGIIAPIYCRPSQLTLYKMLRTHKKVVAKAHRRAGKTTTIAAYISELSHRSKTITRFGGVTQTKAHEIIEYIFGQIYEKCPQHMPKFSDGRYIWKQTGSELFVFGNANSKEADRGRGSYADILWLDEYGLWSFKPKYTLESILSPQIDTSPRGQTFITSTPPVDMMHDYCDQVRDAEMCGFLWDWPIEKSLALGEITKAQHQDIIDRCGGVDTETYKREYQCMMIANSSYLVIPEAHQREFVGEQPRPDFRNHLVMMDLGFTDNFAALFAYVDFANARLVIEDEYVCNYKSTRDITEALKAKESALGIKKPFWRRGDSNDPQQLFDMSKDHGYQVSPITKRKDDQSRVGFRDSVINQLRLGLTQGKVLIHPRCVNTIAQVKYGIWNEQRTDFERSEKMGHLDALMTLCYLYDNTPWHNNPFPMLPTGMTRHNSFIDPKIFEQDTKNTDAIKKIFRQK